MWWFGPTTCKVHLFSPITCKSCAFLVHSHSQRANWTGWVRVGRFAPKPLHLSVINRLLSVSKKTPEFNNPNNSCSKRRRQLFVSVLSFSLVRRFSSFFFPSSPSCATAFLLLMASPEFFGGREPPASTHLVRPHSVYPPDYGSSRCSLLSLVISSSLVCWSMICSGEKSCCLVLHMLLLIHALLLLWWEEERRRVGADLWF